MRRVTCDRHDYRELSDGWTVAGTAPGVLSAPARLDDCAWSPAQVPGTVAGALGLRDSAVLDGQDWWFRTSFDAEPAANDEQLVLALDGIATLAEVYLNGERIAGGESMFAGYEVDIGDVVRPEGNELVICCRALTPRLAERRKPRARWRTKLVSDGNLRFFRTMLIGRAPGFAPGPAVVGPWRPVRLERRRGAVLDSLRLRPRLDGARGVLSIEARLRPLGSDSVTATVELLHASGATHRADLAAEQGDDGVVTLSGELTVADVQRWWPHTHGQPSLYGATLSWGGVTFDLGTVGFRTLSTGKDLERDGIQLSVNDASVFARGAVWTPLDLTAPDATEGELRRVLGLVVEGGMNMIRVPGIGCYESERFYELCDELGILVWQDFMFANLDYPDADPDFMAAIQEETRAVLDRLGGRPCLTVLCGGSEVAQQIAMLGLDPALATGPLYGELLPSLVTDAELDAPYVPSAPWGGDLPFRPNRGIANYYGVGAYLRPLEDARRSEVRFAAECLAFANVPDDDAIERLDTPGGLVVHHPAWKAGVPRDAGAGWDFEDVRDHYLRQLFGVDPVDLRWVDHERYLELSRAVSGEVMGEVFGEWRRTASPCGGGLVLWLTDVVPGSGWGVLDDRGEPKVAFHHLRRALAPVALWTTDEGLGGIDVHVANDQDAELIATLRVALYRDQELCIGEHVSPLELEPHGVWTDNLEQLLGRFVDAAWAYRFGPPAQDVIVVSLEEPGGDQAAVLSQSFRLPAGRPTTREPTERLGLTARMRTGDDGRATVTVAAKRFIYGARIAIPGYRPRDDAFSIEPGRERRVELVAVPGGDGEGRGSVSALNVAGRVLIEEEPL
jgi:beta-mannosidase